MKGSSTARKDRTYDAEGFTKRAGCLCFKTDREEEVLLITSNSSPDQWIVPAGGVEAGEENEIAANREILEEAGVCGNIVRSLGMFQVEKEDGLQSMKPGPDSPTGPTSNPTCVTSCSQNGEQTPVLQCVSTHKAK